MVKRAITLAGGGPCAGLHIGALEGFHQHGFEFDVWSLSCIGAWVGIVYNSFPPETAPQDTARFFHENVFRDDQSYAGFPINHAFSPDILRNTHAMMQFMSNPATYANLFAPEAIQRTSRQLFQYMSDPSRWNEGDTDNLMLEMMAANPMTRFMVSAMYLSPMNGLSRIYFENSSFLKSIDFDRVWESDRLIYHNAWNLKDSALDHFVNNSSFVGHKHSSKERPMLQLTRQSMCACSALPFIEETVNIDGTEYSEGALIKTVDFYHLLNNHDDLDEVWIVRIVDPRQARAPQNIKDGLSNLCMIFAGSLGKENVHDFETVLKEREEAGKPLKVKAIPLEVSADVDFDWNHSNLSKGIELGRQAAKDAIAKYDASRVAEAGDKVIWLNEQTP